MLFLLVQVVYWLALSTWFGGVLFLAVAQEVIIRTARDEGPGEQVTLLADTIIANLISALIRIELVCAPFLAAGIVGQSFLVDISLPYNRASAFVRSGLFIAAAAIVMYDWRFLSPRIAKFRREFLDNADDPDKANPALEQLSRYRRDSVTFLSILFCLLLGIILFSGGMSGPSITFTSASSR